MSDKLLRSFIEASGYTIKEIHIPLDDLAVSEWNNKWRNANTSPVPPKPTATIDYKVTKKDDNYALSINPKFTKEQRIGFIDREIAYLSRRKEVILDEKTI